MDLQTIQTDLSKLTQLVEGWQQQGSTEPIERDMALELLRKLYDAIRFETTAAAAPAVAPVAVTENSDPTDLEPEPIDLSEVFSLDPLSEPEELPTEEPPFEPEPEPAPAPEPQLTPAFEPEPTPESQPEPAPTPEPTPAPAIEPEQPKQPEAQPVAATLFGDDEELMRHRHKQRVIMSLYDPAPAPAPKTEESDSVFEEVTVTTPVVEVAAPQEATEEVAEVTEQTPQQPATDESFDLPQNEEVPPIDSDEPEPEAEPRQIESTEEEEENFEIEEVTIESDKAEQLQTEPLDSPATTLGDAINPHIQTLGDSLAAAQTHTSIRNEEPIDELQQAIGINDKFLMIRDLFGGDGEAFDRTISDLNGFDNLDDCMIYIAENYAWNANSDGAKLLMELLERKFA